MGFGGCGLLVGVCFISQMILRSSTLSATPCVYEFGIVATAPFPWDGVDRTAWGMEGLKYQNEFRESLGLGLPPLVYNPQMCGGVQWVANRLALPWTQFGFSSEFLFVQSKCGELICRSARLASASEAAKLCGLDKLDPKLTKELMIAAKEVCISYAYNGFGTYYYVAHYFPPPQRPTPPICIFENGKPVTASGPWPTDIIVDRVAWAKEAVKYQNEFRQTLGLPPLVYNPQLCGGVQWFTNKLVSTGTFQFSSTLPSVETKCAELICRTGTLLTPAHVVAKQCAQELVNEKLAKEVMAVAKEVCITYTRRLLGEFVYAAHYFPQPQQPPSTSPATTCVYEKGKPVEAPLPVDVDRIAWGKEGVAKHNQFRKELGITGVPDIAFNPKMCGGAQWVTNRFTRPGEPFVRAGQMDSVNMRCTDFICQRQAQKPASASEISNCWLNKTQEVVEVLTAAKEMCITYSHNEMGTYYYTVHFFPTKSPPTSPPPKTTPPPTKPPPTTPRPPSRGPPPCIYKNGIPMSEPFPNDGTDRIAWAKEGVPRHNERRKELGITGLPDIVFSPGLCGSAQWMSNKWARHEEGEFQGEDSIGKECAILACTSLQADKLNVASNVSNCMMTQTDMKKLVDVLTAAREMCITYAHDDQKGVWYYIAHYYPRPPKGHDPGSSYPEGRGVYYPTPTPRGRTTLQAPPPAAPPPPPPPPTPAPPPALGYTFIV